MYWANRKSDFYGTRLDSLGPIRLRLATLGLSALDFIMERLTAGSIFNLMPEELEIQEYQSPPGPLFAKSFGNSRQ